MSNTAWTVGINSHDVPKKDSERIFALANQPQTPKRKAEFSRLMRKYPTVALSAGQLARHVEANLVERFQGTMLQVGTETECVRMRRELGYPQAPELERMLIDRVIACWLHVQYTEYRRHSAWNEGISHASGDFWSRELSKANSNFLRASKALAQVKRLMKPVVQVNIADRQVNVAGPGAIPARKAPRLPTNAALDPTDPHYWDHLDGDTEGAETTA